MATDRELAAQSMMQAGIGSLSGRPSFDLPTSTAREQFIADQGYQRTVVDPIINKGQRAQEIWEKGTGETSPYPTINQTPGSFGTISPSWMEAGITNPNLGGYKVMDAGGLDYTTWDWGKLNPFSWFNNEKIREENEQLQEQIDESYKLQDEMRMGPNFFEPGPWNEFDPSDKEKEYFFRYLDDEGEGYVPSDDYLGGTSEVAQSQWKRPENVEKQIDVLEIRPEFEGWSRDEIKAYIFRSTRQVNRGGLMSLV
jgi:hypothetical protein